MQKKRHEVGVNVQKSCDVASHAHEDGLGGQLKGPKSNLLETPFTGFIVYNVSCKRIISLSMKLVCAYHQEWTGKEAYRC